jgi:hypothetical protein
MGVNNMWAKRDPAKVAGALSQIQQLQNGTQATGPAMAQGQPMPGDTAGPAQAPVPQYQIKSGI